MKIQTPFLWFLLFVFSIACSKEELNEETTTQDEVIVDENDSLPDTQTPNNKTYKYLALGDSYTIGQSVAVENRFPNQLKKQLLSDSILVDSVRFIATTGWTTSNLIQALNNTTVDEDYDLVSLLIGVNNQFRGLDTSIYVVEFESLLQKAIAYAGGDKDKVWVVSIPDYRYTPFGASYSESTSDEIDWYNATKKSISEQYGVAYFNITPISRKGLDQPDLVASDGLHPSAKMYKLWIAEFYDHVKNLLKN